MKNPDIQPVESHKTACVGEKTTEFDGGKMVIAVPITVLVEISRDPVLGSSSPDAKAFADAVEEGVSLVDFVHGIRLTTDASPIQSAIERAYEQCGPTRLSPRLQRAFDRLRDNGD